MLTDRRRDFLSRLSAGLQKPGVPEVLLGLGAGLLQGQNWGEGLGLGLQNATQAAMRERLMRAQAAEQQWLEEQAAAKMALEQAKFEHAQEVAAQRQALEERKQALAEKQLAEQAAYRQQYLEAMALQRQPSEHQLLEAELRARRLDLDERKLALEEAMAPFRAGYMTALGTGKQRDPWGPGEGQLVSDEARFQLIGFIRTSDGQRVPVPNDGKWKEAGNVVAKDGTPLGVGFFNDQYPGLWYRAADGELKLAPPGARKVSVSAGGPIATSQLYKLEDEILMDEVGLERMARYMETVGGTNVGLQRAADAISFKLKTLFDTGELTPEELNLQLAQGQLQGLLGAVRVEVLGPGVMTEQDAARLVAYLGGDVGLLSNPQVVQEALGKVFQDKYARYRLKVEQYNRQAPYHNLPYRSQKDIQFIRPATKKEQVDLEKLDEILGID